MTALDRNAPVLVTGGTGMVGSQVVRSLLAGGFTRVLAPGRSELDLGDRDAVHRWMLAARPAAVIHCAGKVGGIVANRDFPTEFFDINLRAGLNVLAAAHAADVPRLVNLGSTCIYPRDCAQPIREDSLLTGPLEPTNEGYALAKIGVLKYCEFHRQQFGRPWFSVMPTNVYGDRDNYHPRYSHAFPALLRKVVTAWQQGERTVPVWGSGRPIREFVHAVDVAEAIIHLLDTYDGSAGIVNIGTGVGVTIRDLVETMLDVLHYDAELRFDATQPDGTPVKICDVSRLAALGFRSRIDLRNGIRQVVAGLDLDQPGFTWHERH